MTFLVIIIGSFMPVLPRYLGMINHSPEIELRYSSYPQLLSSVDFSSCAQGYLIVIALVAHTGDIG